MAGSTVHAEEAVDNLVNGTLAFDQEGVDNRLLEVFETLVVRTVHRGAVQWPEFISRITHAVIKKPRFIAPVEELVNRENKTLLQSKPCKRKDAGIS